MSSDVGVTREHLAALAQSIIDVAVSNEKAKDLGLQMVLVVTDESGDYVGVGRNVDDDRTCAILYCAMHGEDRIDHSKQKKDS
jgi:hypothetical protein